MPRADSSRRRNASSLFHPYSGMGVRQRSRTYTRLRHLAAISSLLEAAGIARVPLPRGRQFPKSLDFLQDFFPVTLESLRTLVKSKDATILPATIDYFHAFCCLFPTARRHEAALPSSLSTGSDLQPNTAIKDFFSHVDGESRRVNIEPGVVGRVAARKARLERFAVQVRCLFFTKFALFDRAAQCLQQDTVHYESWLNEQYEMTAQLVLELSQAWDVERLGQQCLPSCQLDRVFERPDFAPRQQWQQIVLLDWDNLLFRTAESMPAVSAFLSELRANNIYPIICTARTAISSRPLPELITSKTAVVYTANMIPKAWVVSAVREKFPQKSVCLFDDQRAEIDCCPKQNTRLDERTGVWVNPWNTACKAWKSQQERYNQIRQKLALPEQPVQQVNERQGGSSAAGQAIHAGLLGRR